MTGTEVHRFVTAKLVPLQAKLAAAKKSSALAELAHLRQGVGKPAGSVPAIWGLTIGGLVSRGKVTDEPTPEETAAHIAMTLFAVHQQSKPQPMHRPGAGLGGAVARLAGREGSPGHDAVRRRFDAVCTASSVDEVAHHLRGLVGQFRGEGISLDYAQLAEDLWRLQRPGGFDSVRRAWGRDFYRRRPEQAEHAEDEATVSVTEEPTHS